MTVLSLSGMTIIAILELVITPVAPIPVSSSPGLNQYSTIGFISSGNRVRKADDHLRAMSFLLVSRYVHHAQNTEVC